MGIIDYNVSRKSRHGGIKQSSFLFLMENQRDLNANSLVQISSESYGPPTFCYRHTIYVKYNLLIILNVYFSLNSLYDFFVNTLLHMMVYCHHHHITTCRIFAKVRNLKLLEFQKRISKCD